jgi:hypothetical protein
MLKKNDAAAYPNTYRSAQMSEKKSPTTNPPRPIPQQKQQKQGQNKGYNAPPPPKPQVPSKKGR